MITIPQAIWRYAVGGSILNLFILSLIDQGNMIGRAFLYGLHDVSVWIIPALMLPPIIGSVGAIIARRRSLMVRLVWAITISISITFIIKSNNHAFKMEDLAVAVLAGIASISGWMVDATKIWWKRSEPQVAYGISAVLLFIAGLAYITIGAIKTIQEAPAPIYI